MIRDIENKFRKCFKLAVKGETLAFPNPNVACLIYFNEELVASGIHQEFGKAHAEVNAINNLKEYFTKHSDLQSRFSNFQNFASSCEFILNLEPCSHYGNTPPCTLLIEESGFRKIAFAAYDTNPIVYKKSLEKFSDSSYEVTRPEDLSKEIQSEAQFINRAFFSVKKKEASNELAVYISLKIASYPNGNMITKEGDQWITGEESRKDVHRLRSTNQIIITSSSTLKADKAKYNVRHSAEDLDLLDTKDPDLCVIYHQEKIEAQELDSSRKVFYEKLDDLEKESLEKLIRKLSFQGYQKIIIEAGPRISHAFLESGLVDEFIAYQPKEDRSESEFIESVKNEFQFDNSRQKVFDFEKDFKVVFY
jgi:diaminohydroxyphosphoribosylaminopyrimidine deaminase / 5-amino-6-(5-phosphoribosylamino)uracil reductase